MVPRASRSSRLAFVTLKDAVDLARCPVRLEILAVLSLGARDVTSLAAYLDLEISHVSRMLHKLAQADYVVCVREGQRRRPR